MATLSSIITPSNVETASSTSTLTNKTISGSSNTITNVPLSTAVTGTLPIANGGTGTTSTTFANLTTNVTGTLPVANGGTGAASLTANNVLLGNGTSAVQVVAPGSSGNVLTSNGTTWASSAPSTGALVLISTTTASGSANTLDITSGFSSTYDDYLIIGENIKLGVNGADNYALRFYTASTLRTSAYQFAQLRGGGTAAASRSSSDVRIDANPNFLSSTTGSLRIFLQNINSTSARIQGEVVSICTDDTDVTGNQNAYTVFGYTGNSSALTGIRLYWITGTSTFSSGTFKLYGIAK